MLRAVHQLLVSVFARGISEISKDRNSPTSSPSSRCCPQAAFAPSATFPASHGTAVALGATIKVNLTSSRTCCSATAWSCLPTSKERTRRIWTAWLWTACMADELVTQARVVQTTGQIFTAVKNAKAVEMPLRARVIVEQLRRAAKPLPVLCEGSCVLVSVASSR